MITQKDIKKIVQTYDKNSITIGVLGGHSALDVCRGAKKFGFKTLAVCQKGREKTYAKYYKSRNGKGCIDDVIIVDKFEDVVRKDIQKELIRRNTIFIHNRYFWVYFKNFDLIEKEFLVPIYGNRILVKLEERDQPNNQYELLQKAGIRIPIIIREGDSKMPDEKLKKILDEHFV
jgi:5-formaminoimidazole-4-carboxamide-1-(beta)-D-ribofuranosyl 5'-monophosphate synthetase